MADITISVSVEGSDGSSREIEAIEKRLQSMVDAATKEVDLSQFDKFTAKADEISSIVETIEGRFSSLANTIEQISLSESSDGLADSIRKVSDELQEIESINISAINEVSSAFAEMDQGFGQAAEQSEEARVRLRRLAEDLEYISASVYGFGENLYDSRDNLQKLIDTLRSAEGDSVVIDELTSSIESLQGGIDQTISTGERMGEQLSTVAAGYDFLAEMAEEARGPIEGVSEEISSIASADAANGLNVVAEATEKASVNIEHLVSQMGDLSKEVEEGLGISNLDDIAEGIRRLSGEMEDIDYQIRQVAETTDNIDLSEKMKDASVEVQYLVSQMEALLDTMSEGFDEIDLTEVADTIHRLLAEMQGIDDQIRQMEKLKTESDGAAGSIEEIAQSADKTNQALRETSRITNQVSRNLNDIEDSAEGASNSLNMLGEQATNSLSVEAYRAAEQLRNIMYDLDREQRARVAEIREHLARGFITSDQAADEGRKAAQAYNDALLSAIDEARSVEGALEGPFGIHVLAEVTDSLRNVEQASRGAVAGLGRVNRSMLTIMRQATGAHPVVAQLANAVGSFALGAGPMLGILAGLTALGFGIRHITEEARETRKATEDALKGLRDLERQRILGPGGDLVEQINKALELIPELEARIVEMQARIAQAEPGTGFALLPALDKLRERIEEAERLSAGATQQFQEEETKRAMDARRREASDLAALIQSNHATEAERQRALQLLESYAFSLRQLADEADTQQNRLHRLDVHRMFQDLTQALQGAGVADLSAMDLSGIERPMTRLRGQVKGLEDQLLDARDAHMTLLFAIQGIQPGTELWKRLNGEILRSSENIDRIEASLGALDSRIQGITQQRMGDLDRIASEIQQAVMRMPEMRLIIGVGTSDVARAKRELDRVRDIVDGLSVGTADYMRATTAMRRAEEMLARARESSVTQQLRPLQSGPSASLRERVDSIINALDQGFRSFEGAIDPQMFEAGRRSLMDLGLSAEQAAIELMRLTPELNALRAAVASAQVTTINAASSYAQSAIASGARTSDLRKELELVRQEIGNTVEGSREYFQALREEQQILNQLAETHRQLTVTLVNQISQVAQAWAQARGMGMLGTSLIGAAFGIGAALLATRNRPQPVRLEELSSRASDQMNRRQGPDRITLNVISPDGRMLDQTEYVLRRREERDAAVRVPRGVQLSGGGNS